MPKRTRSPSQSSLDEKPSVDEVKPTVSPPKKALKGKPDHEKKTTKTPWTPSEDSILLTLLEDLMKNHLWPLVKADGRLVARTNYGVQYHAKMLLRQGMVGRK